MNMCCPPTPPVAGVEDIVAPVANWASCMIMHCVHHYCHIACIASFLMGRGYDYQTALAMAQDIMRQGMNPMGPGMGAGMMPGMMPGMAPGMMPGMMPGMAPGMMPGMMPGMAPGMGAGMMPGMTTPGMSTPAAAGIYG